MAAACCTCSPISLNRQLTSGTDDFSEYGKAVVRLPRPGPDFDMADFLKKFSNKVGVDAFLPMMPMVEASENLMSTLMQVKAEQPSPSPTLAKTVAPYSPRDRVRQLTGPQSMTPSLISSSADQEPSMLSGPYGEDSFHAQDQAGRYTFRFKGGPSSQLQARDVDGRYAYGHWGGPTAHFEAMDHVDGTAGVFSYVNPEGEVEMRMYLANNDDGIRVAASDLPVDNPDVAELKAANAYAHAMRTLPTMFVPQVDGSADQQVYKAQIN